MPPSSTAQPQRPQQVPDAIVRLGGWLFKRRTLLPLPIAVVLLAVPPAVREPYLIWAGAVVVGIGEFIRLAAVRHIGVISRTRSERLGPLVSGGPFGWVRNPLYVGNLLLWAGFTISARLPWLLPPTVALLAIEYHAIVRWEETFLASRLGEAYRDYISRVPRWMPMPPRTRSETIPPPFKWRETLFSERGTLIAIAVGYALLLLKERVLS
jgi:protein-S-isoprenylcysteine O-methyltransferase Ste14